MFTLNLIMYCWMICVINEFQFHGKKNKNGLSQKLKRKSEWAGINKPKLLLGLFHHLNKTQSKF